MSREDATHSKFLSQGGFLRQPCFDHSPATSQGCSLNIVDMKSWEAFSCFLSAITWPSILECLIKGKEFIDNKSCQMTCVRLLETVPVVFERISASASRIPHNLEAVVSRIFDLKWLSDLADWGKSSLVVVTRHWKQSILSLLNLIKGNCHVSVACTIGAIETMVNSDAIAVDKLKERLSQLSILLYKGAIGSVVETSANVESLRCEHFSHGRKSSVADSSYPEGPELKDLYIDKLSLSKRKEDNVIVLSDDETERVPSLEVVILSSSKSSEHLLEKKSAQKGSSAVADNLGPARATSSRETLEPSLSNVREYSVSTSQKHGGHVLDKCQSYSEFVSPVVRDTVSPVQPKFNATTCLSFKQVDSVSHGSSAYSFPHAKTDLLSTANVEWEKRVDTPKDAIFDADNDPLESAVDFVRHQPQLTKSSIPVPKRKVIQLEMPVNNKHGLLNRMDNGVRRLKPPKLDDWYRPILEIDYFSIVGLSSDSADVNVTVPKLKQVPPSFVSPDHYIEIFRPLVLEEFKAQLQNSFLEASSSDEIFCGNLCVISVERVDDFHVVRARPEDNESARTFSENDLVLLTKEPLENSAQHLHVIGKVERRERNDKNRSTILVIRFYFQSGSSRLNRVSRLLIERSKWYVSRIMSITPQIREFQALSSLSDIPMLPVILQPADCSPSFSDSGKVELHMLSLSMQNVLKSSFNDSQLQAISVAIGTQGSKRSFELSLVQGPPGTGKTRTIVAIVSALLSLGSSNQHGSSKELNKNSRQDSATFSTRTRINQSSAIARAWQDAAYAKQMIRDEEEARSGSSQHLARGRVLICAQSNAAVDELVSRIKEGLFGDDGKMYRPYLVRVGNVKTVHPSSLPYFIDTLVEQRLNENKSRNDARNDASADSFTLLQARLEKLVESIRLYESKRAKLRDEDIGQRKFSEDGPSKADDVEDMSDAAIESKLNILYGQKKAICADLAVAQAREKKLSEENRFIRQKIRKSILREAEIVVTTLSGCGGDIYGTCFDFAARKLENFSEHSLFDVVIIDEAAQALEPATLIPLQLLKSNSTKCVMVGDPKQLPATVLSSVASKFFYECSMFERMQRAGYPVVMLTEQYRMHPEICRFPSMHFYEGKLLNGCGMTSKSASFHEIAHLGPYMFFDVIDGHESHGKKSGSLSLYNESEADAAVEIIKFFMKRYFSEFASGRIGVVTPYKSQLSLLRSRFSNAFGSSVTADIEFNTVDGFQGREVDILILSTVRASISNGREHGSSSNSIGFVADVRRMNVALTRAKLSLWIIGNARTLQTNPHWCVLVKDAKERNMFMSVYRPYWSIFGGTTRFSKKGPSSPLLEMSSRQKKSSDLKDARHLNLSATLNAKEPQQRKTKFSKNEKEMDKTGVVRGHVLNKVDGRERANTDISPGELFHRHKREEQTMKRRIITKTEGDLEGLPIEKVESSSSRHTSKERSITSREGRKSKVASGQLEMDYSIRTLIKKAKRVDKSSECSIPCKEKIMKTVFSQSSTERNYKEKESDSKIMFDGSEDPHKDMISKRKRQRDAVDALLPSALISAKRPESLTKPVPNRRPFPPKTSTINAIKLSCSSKAHPPYESPTGERAENEPYPPV